MLHSNFGIDVRYLCVDGEIADSCSQQLIKKSANQLVDAFRQFDVPTDSRLLLHFSGYGYARWGLCFWLTSGLQRLIREYPKLRLVTMFHELWATGPMTSVAGWTTWPQQKIALRLIQLSSAIRLSRQADRDRVLLVAPTDQRPTEVKPIFSNFGETIELPNLQAKREQILLFQPPEFANTKSAPFWDAWKQLRQRFPHVVTVVAGRVQSLPNDDSIVVHGFISTEMASQLFRESRYGLIDYYPGYLAKSSIFAALAAHGVTCFLPRENPSEADGIERGRHYLLPHDDFVGSGSGQELWNWYQGHNATASADGYRRLLFDE